MILLIAKRRVDEFYSHVDIERQVACKPYRAHRAAAEQALEPEATRDRGTRKDTGQRLRRRTVGGHAAFPRYGDEDRHRSLTRKHHPNATALSKPDCRALWYSQRRKRSSQSASPTSTDELLATLQNARKRRCTRT